MAVRGAWSRGLHLDGPTPHASVPKATQPARSPLSRRRASGDEDEGQELVGAVRAGRPPREAAGSARKDATASVARRYGLPKRAVFDAVVAAKRV